MDPGRAARFGAVGAVGVVLVALSTYGLVGMVWSERISGSGGMVIGTVLLVAIAGTATAVVFLFVVIGAFLDRELEARGLDTPEE
jgi:hypothetical protein